MSKHTHTQEPAKKQQKPQGNTKGRPKAKPSGGAVDIRSFMTFSSRENIKQISGDWRKGGREGNSNSNKSKSGINVKPIMLNPRPGDKVTGGETLKTPDRHQDLD